ncbi:hypothetical protein EDE08_103318 [Bradyrhizobium sp. R2.2-H]|jgi:hypothetical protein|uniref:hypothetical protein n=1 Tax=unclassified Bradyrhizobium TaxID=2631580 RepID=UPI001042CBF3|nr:MULTISPECIES: hypothetical protein [unclassified Bradyrhizobium]TCU75101.1 hypothetical protein EDE10_103317 [Bradyrhizobium sp. Y-H1]TCU77869.1 hypothetical protein EDE08_103318 [Bradyrhizobium sp. R2.2-H]
MRAESSTVNVLASGAFFIARASTDQSETRAVPSISNIEQPCDQLVWGAKAIGKVIGRSEKGAFHALESGRVPGAKKIAGRWGMHVPTFLASFTESPRTSVAA